MTHVRILCGARCVDEVLFVDNTSREHFTGGASGVVDRADALRLWHVDNANDVSVSFVLFVAQGIVLGKCSARDSVCTLRVETTRVRLVIGLPVMRILCAYSVENKLRYKSAETEKSSPSSRLSTVHFTLSCHLSNESSFAEESTMSSLSTDSAQDILVEQGSHRTQGSGCRHEQKRPECKCYKVFYL